jgi:UTP:GlnB (protein PII) uridylyltransferase
LRKDEVRALARRVEDSTLVRLTIAARDRRGLLADSAAVLTSNGLSIVNASASTWAPQKLALHSFIVEGGVEFEEEDWDTLGERLRSMVSTGHTDQPDLPALHPVTVTVQGSGTVSGSGTVQGSGDRCIVKVVAPDANGLLSTICRYFQTHGVNIETLQARAVDGTAHGTFLVEGDVEAEGLKAQLEHSHLPLNTCH